MKTALLLLPLATMALACSDENSTVVVSVYSSAAPIPRVAQLRVRAQAGVYSQELLYPEKPRAEDALLELNSATAKATPVTFSMSFRPMFKGTVVFNVEALDPSQVVLASGASSPEQLRTGQVTNASVMVSPACDPLQPSATCGNGLNCAFVCDPETHQSRTSCMKSGLKSPGEICGDLADCAPGAECFEFTCQGTTIKTCRKFCASDADCGTDSACNLSISCSASTTKASICSRPCDPTGNATGGCVQGLHCFVYAGEVTDCACSPSTRTGGTGQACTGDDGCLPGLTCVERGGQKTCRPLCTVASSVSVCPTGTACTALSSPVYKVYGACL